MNNLYVRKEAETKSIYQNHQKKSDDIFDMRRNNNNSLFQSFLAMLPCQLIKLMMVMQSLTHMQADTYAHENCLAQVKFHGDIPA